MAKFVTKKDGERVAFDAGKITHAILSASSETEIVETEAQSIAQEVVNIITMDLGAREEISTDELREKILSELDSLSPAIAEAWRKYDEGKEE